MAITMPGDKTQHQNTKPEVVEHKSHSTEDQNGSEKKDGLLLRPNDCASCKAKLAVIDSVSEALIALSHITGNNGKMLLGYLTAVGSFLSDFDPCSEVSHKIDEKCVNAYHQKNEEGLKACKNLYDSIEKFPTDKTLKAIASIKKLKKPAMTLMRKIPVLETVIINISMIILDLMIAINLLRAQEVYNEYPNHEKDGSAFLPNNDAHLSFALALVMMVTHLCEMIRDAFKRKLTGVEKDDRSLLDFLFKFIKELNDLESFLKQHEKFDQAESHRKKALCQKGLELAMSVSGYFQKRGFSIHEISDRLESDQLLKTKHMFSSIVHRLLKLLTDGTKFWENELKESSSHVTHTLQDESNKNELSATSGDNDTYESKDVSLKDPEAQEDESKIMEEIITSSESVCKIMEEIITPSKVSSKSVQRDEIKVVVS